MRLLGVDLENRIVQLHRYLQSGLAEAPLSSATVTEYRIQEFQQSLKRGDEGPTRRGGFRL
jgi:hypothetical protein